MTRTEGERRRAVIYLTGAPATGKTTVAKYLGLQPGTAVFSYGQELTRRLAGVVSDQDDLRSRSSAVVQPGSVIDLDRALRDFVLHEHSNNHVVIDSHAVTIEIYGFRAVPFSSQDIAILGITHIFCLYSSARTVASRIAADSGGRPLPTLEELERHSELQASLALTYAHTCGCPIYFLSSEGAARDVADRVGSLSGLRNSP